jgi:hypothetical protein
MFSGYAMPSRFASSHANSMYHPDPLHVCPTIAGQTLHVDWQGHLVFCCTLSGYRGQLSRSEIIADLRNVSLYEAQQQLLARIHAFNGRRLERLEQGRATALDYHPCMTCHLISVSSTGPTLIDNIDNTGAG